MGMTLKLDDGRPVIDRISRYVVAFNFGRDAVPAAMTLGDLIARDAPAASSYYMPSRWTETAIVHAREAFADYCRKRGL